MRELFDEFAQRFARGESPDVRDYLARAGGEGEELGRLIDRYLASAPPPDPPEERVELMRAWVAGEPPLLELRRGRGVPRDRVVDAIVTALGFGEKKRERVGLYYHRLETGQLDPARVDRRVFDAIASLLGVDVRDLVAGWREPVRPAPAAFLRASEPPAEPLGPPSQEQAEWDEVDEAFTGGR